MNGIDISNWQSGMNLKKIQADFVIMKATEGNYYADPTMGAFYKQALESGKLRGLYHFASGKTSGKSEAEYFVDHIRKYIGGAILVLDWEGEAKDRGAGYAKEFLDTVFDLTGVRPFIYMSKGLTQNIVWSSVAEKYPLWVAQYANYVPVYGYQDNPWTDSKGYGPWKAPSIFQYTSSGRLDGWQGRLDFDKAYITPADWWNLAAPEKKSEKSVDEIAAEVLENKWGVGSARKAAITAAGYDYNAVQRRVNEILKEQEIHQLAVEVIAGKYGSGLIRRIRLGTKYAAVQKEVNRILSGR